MEPEILATPNPQIQAPVVETPQVIETPVTPEPPSVPENVPFGKYFQTAQVVIFGLMTATFVYSIYYYKKKLDNDPIISLTKEVEQVKHNLQKLMGSNYEN